jgi:outer membrane biosynthesis protein TonB
MGNTEFIGLLDGASNCPTSKRFNIEDMIKDATVEEITNKFRDECNRYPLSMSLDDVNGINIEFGQRDRLQRAKDNVSEDMNEIFTAGFCNPESYLQKLKEPRFQKYFNPTCDDTRSFDDVKTKNHCKFFLLYCYIAPYYSSQSEEAKDFLKELAKRCEEYHLEKIESYSLIIGMVFSFSVLEEIKYTKPDMVEKALKHMYNTLAGLKDGALKESCSDYSNKMEHILTQQRDFLVKLISDDQISESIKSLCVRILLQYGRVKGSGEDYLFALNAVNHFGFETNFTNDIQILSDSKAQSTQVAEEFKVEPSEGNPDFEIKLFTGFQNSPSNTDTIAFDMDQYYVYMKVGGKSFQKVGVENGIKVKAGLTYEKNSTELVDLKNHSVCVTPDFTLTRHVYYSEHPVRIWDSKTMALQEDHKLILKLKENQRNFDEDDWNKRIFEISDQEKLKDIITKSIRGSFRCLRKTPMFYDGTNLCVIATNYIKGDTENDQIQFQTMEKFFTIEIYDPSTFNFIKEIKLDFEKASSSNEGQEQQTQEQIEDLEELKENMFDERFETVNLAHNFKHITISYKKKLFVFDFETGKRLTDAISIPHKPDCFNRHDSRFWYVDRNNYEFTVASFKLIGFDAEGNSSYKLSDLETLISKRVRTEVKKASQNMEPLPKRGALSLLKRLTTGKSQYTQSSEQVENTDKNSKEVTSFLISAYLHNCLKKDSEIIQKFDKTDKNDAERKFELSLNLFRNRSWSISKDCFDQLLISLEHYKSCFSKKAESSEILAYQLMTVVKLANSALQSTIRLDISLDQIFQDHNKVNSFLKNIKHAMILINEGFSEQIEPGKPKFNEESYVVWQECHKIAQELQFLLLNLSSESSGNSLGDKISELISSIKSDKITSSHTVFLRYLGSPATLESVVNSKATKAQIEQLIELFKILIQRKTQKLVDVMNGAPKTFEELGQKKWKVLPSEIEYSTFEQNAEGFTYQFVKRVLIHIFSPFKAIYKAQQDDNAKKSKDIREKIESEMWMFNLLFDISSESNMSLYTKAGEVLKKAQKITEPHVDHQNKFDEKVSKSNTEAMKPYFELAHVLREILFDHNKCSNYCLILLLSIGSDSAQPERKSHFKAFMKACDLIQSYSKFQDIHSNNIIFKSERNRLMSEDLKTFETIQWLIGKFSSKLIKATSNFGDNEKILNSKLLQGGVDPAFYHKFSKETQKELDMVKELFGDNDPATEIPTETQELLDLLDSKEEHKEGSGNLIALFEWHFNKQSKSSEGPSTKEELQAITCVFVAMVKANDLCKEFSQCSAKVQNVPESEFAAKYAELDVLPEFRKLCRRWSSSHKIKSWMASKIKNSETDLVKKAKEKAETDKKVEEEKKAEEEKKTEEEKKEEPEEEEKIDTNIKKPEYDQEKVDKDLSTYKSKLLKSFSEYAEFILRLGTPPSWDQKINDRKVSTFASGKDIGGKRGLTKSKTKQPRKMKRKQTSLFMDKLNKKDDKDSCQGSILALFKMEINTKSLWEDMQKIYLNSYRRFIGLKLMSKSLSLSTGLEHFQTILNWFTYSIRPNPQKICHFTEDLPT